MGMGDPRGKQMGKEKHNLETVRALLPVNACFEEV